MDTSLEVHEIRVEALPERAPSAPVEGGWRVACAPCAADPDARVADAVQATVDGVARAVAWTSEDRDGREALYVRDEQAFGDARRAAIADLVARLRRRHVRAITTSVRWDAPEVLADLIEAGMHVNSQVVFGGVTEVELGLRGLDPMRERTLVGVR